MNRNEILELMKDVYTSSEAAEYLNISTQRLNQLVHDKRLEPIKATKSIMLFLKSDLEERKVMNVSSLNLENREHKLNLDLPVVKDAMFYFTIQQNFSYSDKKTCQFIKDLYAVFKFKFSEDLNANMELLSRTLRISYSKINSQYELVRNSFAQLSEDVIIAKKGDSIYPKLLAKTDDAPPFLFLKGNINLLEEKSVCVVGSRNASDDSLNNTKRIVRSLIQRNIVVNAGLARGIDTATHTAALENGGKTIAVIGTPINQYYPKENRELQIEIEKKGLVISQFPPCNPVNRWNFPIRNATMSGISLATIIMEAGETSGALKQADYALKQGRDVLIPQSAIDNPLIQWPKKYVERGAHKFRTLREALEVLNNNEILAKSFTESNQGEITNVEMD